MVHPCNFKYIQKFPKRRKSTWQDSRTIQSHKRVKQGWRCCLSLTLFIQQAIRNWRKSCDGMGIEANDRCLTTLLFADDQVIVVNCIKGSDFTLRILVHEYEEWDLYINANKAKYLSVGT